MDLAMASASDARTAGVAYFDPDKYSINLIRRAVTNKQDIVLTAAGIGDILILSTRGEYFSQVSDMERFCTTPAAQLQVRVLTPNDPGLPSSDQHGRNIDELMWQAAFYASAGRLLTGWYRDDVVELSQWPNLTRLPLTPNSMRIAAFFSRYPTSITLARSLLKIEREELYQFYSAARCAGIARAVNRKPAEPRLEPHRNHTLLSALLSKIARL